jgi:hypothetical protein
MSEGQMSVGLRLLAEDGADLDVMSAAAQDALLRVGDVRFDAKARRFTAQLSRFRWEKVDSEGAFAKGAFERVASVVAFEGVLAVKSRRVRVTAPDAIASVLAFRFEPDAEPPGGEVQIVLAGGGEIALSVECLDAVLFDTDKVWRTPRRPDHEKA